MSLAYIIHSYIDDIFFTSNEPLEKINQMLDEVNNLHPNIKLVRQLGTSVSFLDLFIKNQNGTLVTSVFHKQAAEPYIVPFKSDHPRQIFKNAIDTALKRAVRYSSTLSAFHTERRSIKLMLLYNWYMLYFIHNVTVYFSISVIHQDIYTINSNNSFHHTSQYQKFYQRFIMKMIFFVYVTYY
jgi:hypothetical protein